MTGRRAKRFYHAVATAVVAGEHVVTLDGRPALTPERRQLALPTAAAAAAVAAEWQAQEASIDPGAMPLSQLACIAIDRVAPRRAAVIAEIVRYAESDLLCYRACGPPELVARQERHWQPLASWFGARFGALLRVTLGVVPVGQDPAVERAVARALADTTDYALAALYRATTASGSAVLALALAEGRVDAAEAWTASRVDESFQAECSGHDAEAETRARLMCADLAAAQRFLELLRP
ncbi:MAG: ATPase [Alphaproteobacteria bacterium]|nr:ATPase [Alphaproteobacteria bacterium]